MRKFGLRNSATIISVSNIKQNDMRPAFRFYLRSDIQMWEDLLTSRLILRRRHINFSNLIAPLLKATCFLILYSGKALPQMQHPAPLYGTSPLNSATEVYPSLPESAVYRKQQTGRAALWLRQFVLGISPSNPGFDRRPVDPVDSVSFLHTLRYLSLHSAPHSSQITTGAMQSWLRHHEIKRFLSSLFLDVTKKMDDLIYRTAEA